MKTTNNLDGIYIYPTDTVWGIGCSIYSESGYKRIAEIKKTEMNKPLSIMFSQIDKVMASFELPPNMTLPWLKKFFELETTLGLPLISAKIKIPPWAVGESSYVHLRCLETEIIKKIYQEINEPFFTTSLNLSGMPPITELSEAIEFQKMHAPDALLILPPKSSTCSLSGSSSTIVFLNEKKQFEMKREGKRSEEVKKQILNYLTMD
jgi:L-threonylcarbamoyladenylate synthase